MGYLGAFDDFDPKVGELPPVLSGTFAYIAHMARGVLEKRNADAIRAAVPALDWMLWQTSEALEKERLEEVLKYGEVVSFGSPAATLRETMKRYEIRGQEDFPDATWPEYFAVLALAIVGNTVSAPTSTVLFVMNETPERDYLNLKIAGEWAAEAMEAAIWASALDQYGNILADGLAGEGRRKISLQHQRAAIARHARTQQFKDGFVEFWHRGAHKSKNDAARKYVANCKKEGIEIPFAPTNRERTLLDHLREVLRSRA